MKQYRVHYNKIGSKVSNDFHLDVPDDKELCEMLEEYFNRNPDEEPNWVVDLQSGEPVHEDDWFDDIAGDNGYWDMGSDGEYKWTEDFETSIGEG